MWLFRYRYGSLLAFVRTLPKAEQHQSMAILELVAVARRRVVGGSALLMLVGIKERATKIRM